MSDYKVIQVEREGAVGHVILNRPEKLNAMGPDFWKEFPQAIRELDADEQIRCIIVRANGKSFTSGLDLMAMGASLQPGAGKGGSQASANFTLFEEIQCRFQDAVTAAEKSKTPVICAIHGHCIGGGVDLATACDIRLATKDAVFSIRETKIAIVADVGTLQRLPRIVGRGVAMELALTGKNFDGQRAKELQIVNEVYDSPEALYAGAREMAGEIAANSPFVVSGVKHILQTCEDMTVDEGLRYVALWNSAFLKTNDLTEAIMSFMQKRKPEFKGK